jgi:L-rhamnose mutarotase
VGQNWVTKDKKMKTHRTCLALDLKNDSELIAEYERMHTPEGIWKEIPMGIKAGGIDDMQIYRIGNHLFMIVELVEGETVESAFAKIGKMERQPEWATFMATFQQKLAEAQPDEHWAKMKQVFALNDCIQ